MATAAVAAAGSPPGEPASPTKQATPSANREASEMLGLRAHHSTKGLVVDERTNYEVEAVKFSILTPEEIAQYSTVKLCNKDLYVPMTTEPMQLGVLDCRLGANKSTGQCQTCGHVFQDCCGHWGHVNLRHPVFHVGYFKHLVNLLYCVCKRCARILLPEGERKAWLSRVRRCQDPIMRRMILKRLILRCKKESTCLDPDCQAPQGVIRRVMKPSMDQFMKIILQMKVKKEGRGSRYQVASEDLDACYVRDLLRRISALDCEILDVSQPEKLLISSLLVPPKCIRPSVTLGDAGSNEDDMTIIFSEIIDLNNIVTAQSKQGFPPMSVLGNWEFMQLQCTRFINSDAPSVAALLATKNISSPGRGICQRLKGKEGRFRGNLSGKRVDFSGRTVISPDANCPIPEVVIPMWSAKRLTFPERVCEATIDRLRDAVLRGADDWPGAAFVLKKDGGKSSLRFANRRQVAENLQVGDLVERHLWNGDIVLFNRQPSLHRLSIMAHKARVLPWRTFRFNECVCTPYNADFDGDEMNCHLPQTQEARAEAYHLMGVVNNLVTPKNGEPLIAATQDFLSGSYLLTYRDTFLTRERFCFYCCYITDGKAAIDMPPPTILKPVELWTGKQVFNVLLRPNKLCENLMVTFELKEREFCKPKDGLPDFMCPREGYIMFRSSELICGALAKSTLGNGSKKGLFFNMIRDNSPHAAAVCMGRIAKLAGRWFANRGMTIGIDDVTPSPRVTAAKKALLEKGFNAVEQEIVSFKKGNMQPNPGCTLEQTLETRVKAILDDLRTVGGKASQDNLPPTNKPLIMFLSGAKGALINIAQMIALVGQQNVGGQRIQNGFVERTLPHFKPRSVDGKARGFVAHSFYDGLDPDEFFFHTMSGREGLVDTAVKTAETGYMQRRLVKALEDLSVKYDRTVRTSDGQIVQFVYGDDGLNPAVMEDKSNPISLDKVYQHIASLIAITSRLEILSGRTPSNRAQLPLQVVTQKKSPDKVDPETTEKVVELTVMGDPLQSDIVTPPIDADQVFLNERLKKHFIEIDKKIRAQQADIRRRLAGWTPTVRAIKATLVGNRKRKLGDTEGGATTSAAAESPAKRLATATGVRKIVTLKARTDTSSAVDLLSEVPPVPRSLEEKLRVLRSWQRSPRFNNNVEAMEADSTYQQAKGNVLAHVVVNEWLPPIKQHAPLLPIEIEAWGDYLLHRTAELLPDALSKHQKLSLAEAPTHQAKTHEVRVFARQLRRWISKKAQEIAEYREASGMARGDTLESYKTALEAMRNTKLEEDAAVAGLLLDDSGAMHARGPYPSIPLARRGWVVPSGTESYSPHKRTHAAMECVKPDEEEASSDAMADLVESAVAEKEVKRWRYNRQYWVTTRHLLEFFRLAWRKYNRALMEPGEAVGATGAQSIGEPGTQMTLKTFHFAGVASMNVTLGVPRIKEIINAANNIMTPIIQVPLINDTSFDYALMVKSRIEKSLLKDICVSIKEVYSSDGAYLSIKLSKETISKLFLDVTAESVRESILSTPGLLGRARLKEELVEVAGDFKLSVRPPGGESLYFDLQALKQKVLTVCVGGLHTIKRGVIKRDERKEEPGVVHYGLAVEGYGLRDVMGTSGVDGVRCTSNHVMEVKEVLGIEAARHVIIDEIRNCMEAYSMDIDCRHMQLLGDVMTFRGDVLGISRFGIQKMRASTLMLASFEETNEHLFEAAVHHKADQVSGVSESIIMGKPVTLGTGAFDILYDFRNQWTGKALDGDISSPLLSGHIGSRQRMSTLLAKYGVASKGKP